MGVDGDLEAVLGQHLTAMNRHDAAAVAALYVEDCHWEEPPGVADVHGHGPLRQYLGLLFQAFPDLSITGIRALPSGTAIVAEWLAEGTHLGSFLGWRGTGRHVRVHGASILDVRDGKVTVSHHYCDGASLLRQLDLLPRGERL